MVDGFAIVVLDRGFVYVGRVAIESDWLMIRDAWNIRYWGTTNGLGELALNGPTEKTRLDQVGTLRAPIRAVISVIETEAKSWTTS